MRILIIGLVVLALSVAGISTYLIQNFSTPEAIGEMEKKARVITYYTLVANFDLQPGDSLTKENMVWRAWPDEGLDEHYITVDEEDQREARFNEVLGSKVRRIIQAGEPILVSKVFKSDNAGFMAGVIDEGMRAISIPVNAADGVSGFILPGDRIDILVIHDKGKAALQKTKKKANDGGEKPENEKLVVLKTTTETVMQNIEVIAVDQTMGKVEGVAIPAKFFTVQLTPKQVEKFMTLRTLGKITYSLRDLTSSSKTAIAEANANADGSKLSPAYVGTYTHDVEVSPFISAVASGAYAEEQETKRLLEEKAKLEAEQALAEAEAAVAKAQSSAAKAQSAKEAAEQKSEELAKKIEAQASQTTQQVQPVTQPAKTEKKKANVVEVYRGGSAATEVIEFK